MPGIRGRVSRSIQARVAKRRRNNDAKRIQGTAPMDNESWQARRAITATPVNFKKAVKKSGEKARIRTESISRGGGNRGPMSNSMITNIMCPIFSYKRIGFGNSWMNRAWNHLPTTFGDRTGTVKSLNWVSNSQAWQEFIGLPMHNWGNLNDATNAYFQQDGFTASVSQLMAKAADVRNDVQNQYFPRPQGTLSAINQTSDFVSNSSRELNWMGLQFDYLGGYQEHTFTNVSESNVSIFLCECKPREVMTGVEEDLSSAGNQWKVRGVGEDLLYDYKQDLPLNNAFKPTYSTDTTTLNNTTTDSVYDTQVRINRHSNLVHRKYLVGKELKVTLKPGDTYTHRMTFDAFNFTESTFNMLSSQVSDVTSTNPNTANSTPPVMLVPLFTKILVVRAKSEYGFEETSGFVSNVGTLPGAVTHLCTEKHTCRMLPTQKPFQSFIDYTLTGAVNRVMGGEEGNNVDVVAANGVAN